MTDGIDRLAIASNGIIGREIAMLRKLRTRLVAAIDRLDGRDATTLIKLGSDIARAVSAIDWQLRDLGIQRKRISMICEEEKGENK